MSVSSTEEGLKRVIGVSGLTLAIISGVIGAGIFVLPGTIGHALGISALLSYGLCGILLASILLCYAEIGSKVSSSGGSYAYVESAFGKFPGYVVNWMYFFGWSVLGSAALLNVVADSLAQLYPLFRNFWLRAVLFFVMTTFMVALNVRGARQSLGLVKAVTLIKLLPLMGIILFGLGYIRMENLQWQAPPSLKVFSDNTLFLFFAFAGFETSLGASGEIKNPGRTVPLSIGIAGIVILVFYMLLQLVVQGIFGSSIGMYKEAPLAAVANIIIGSVGSTVLLVSAAISCFGNVNLDIMCTSRSLFAGAKDGIFPALLGRVHSRFATPHVAVIIYGLLIFGFTMLGDFRQLANLALACVLLIYGAVVLATLQLRRKPAPAAAQGFRAPGGILTPAVALLAISWLLSGLSAAEWKTTLVFIGVVCALYGLTVLVQRKKSSRPGN